MGARTAYPSVTHELTPDFHGVRVHRSLVFYVMFCRSVFVLFFRFSIALYVTLWIRASDWIPIWYLQAFSKLSPNNQTTSRLVLAGLIWQDTYLIDSHLPCIHIDWLIDWLIVFNATFSNISAISWRPVLVLEEAGVPGENHRPWVSN